jgi:hypothetical protein
LLQDWFESAGLPGFVAGEPQLYRLPDGVSGESRYQLLLRVGNREPVTGFARVAWAMQAAGADVDGGTVLVAAPNARVLSEPIRIPGNSAIEFGIVLSEPPAAAYVHPYLSLNRVNFQTGLLNTTEIPRRNAEPLNGVRETALDLIGIDDRIVADDLDDGFTIVTDEGNEDLRLAGRNTAVSGMDQGLPVAGNSGVPRQWSRRASQTGWGRYRHTLAYTGPGEGKTRAVMPASIPAPVNQKFSKNAQHRGQCMDFTTIWRGTFLRS